MCSFTSFIQSLSVNGCILTLTALAINRFYAVAYPLKYNAIKTKRQKRISLIVVWIVAICISTVPLFVNKVQRVRDNHVVNGTYTMCSEVWDEKDEARNRRFLLGYTIWSFMQTYCLPVLILIVMYSCIISILRTRNSSNSYLQESSSTPIQMHDQYEQIKIKTRKVLHIFRLK
jgi:purine-cytosine permease-like protein